VVSFNPVIKINYFVFIVCLISDARAVQLLLHLTTKLKQTGLFCLSDLHMLPIILSSETFSLGTDVV